MRIALLSLLIVAASTSSAWAQPRPSRAALAEARRRFERGIELHDQGNDAAAVVELRVAWELSHRPSALYNLGIALRALRRDDEALEAFRGVLAVEHGASARLLRDAREAVDGLEASLAHVTIELTPAGATLQLDGRDVTVEGERSLVAGEHRLVARLAGHRDLNETFTLSPGEHRALRFALEPLVAPPPPPPPPPPVQSATLTLEGAPPSTTWTIDGAERAVGPVELSHGSHHVLVRALGFAPWEGTVAMQRDTRLRVALSPLPTGATRRWAWVSFGAAGAFVVGAAVLGALAVQTHDEFLSRPREASDVEDLVSRGRALSVGADACAVMAVAGAVVGAVLLLTGDRAAQPSTAMFARGAANTWGAAIRF